MHMSVIVVSSRPLVDEMWKELEESALSSNQDFEGKIKIPSAFHEILVKLESTEVFQLMQKLVT